MKDFSLDIYKRLLVNIKNCNFKIQTFNCYSKKIQDSFIFLRHDVDLRPNNSLLFATIQNELSITGTYYFRIVPQSFNEQIIRQIADMGHEIGYHYETMEKCNGNIDKAYDEFRFNLDVFRKIVPIETICMHGSPLSKFDNRTIWKKYDYKKLGIIAEPYLDLDFNEIFYTTDTGRRWDGEGYSVRDKVLKNNNRISNGFSTWPRYHSTFEIIKAIEVGLFPQKAMMTFHPQRWHDKLYDWSKELILQRAKNLVKKMIYVTIDD